MQATVIYRVGSVLKLGGDLSLNEAQSKAENWQQDNNIDCLEYVGREKGFYLFDIC